MRKKISTILFFTGFLSALGYLIFFNKAPLEVNLVLKSLPTISMCIWMIFKKVDTTNWPIFLGLISSLFCDVFMSLDMVTIGMGCNMLALIFYTIYFLRSDPGLDLLKVIPFLIIFGVIYAFLYKNLEENKIPVLIYCILYVIFLWRSSARIGEEHISKLSQYVCFAGCVSMAFSDLILSITLFNLVASSNLLFIIFMFFWWLGLYLLMITAELKKKVYISLELNS